MLVSGRIGVLKDIAEAIRVVARGSAGGFAESAGEMGLIGEAGSQGNFGYWSARSK